MAGVLPTGVGPAGASSTPPSPAKPNPMPMCWFTVHHRAFKGIGLPSVACDPQGASGSDIRIAAACANRALACQQGQAFLVVGAPAPWSVAPPDTIPLTRVLADLNYVVSSNRSFVSFSSRSRCPSHEKRSPFWMKVVLLSAASRPNSELRQFCTAIGVIDTDVLLYAAHPLTQQPQYVRWHAAPQQILFIAREPASGQVMWQRGSLFDDHGRNNLNNTRVNTGFILAKPGKELDHLLRRWWCGASEEEGLLGSGLGEPLSMYKTVWPYEQRVFDEVILDSVSLSSRIHIAEDSGDYNHPKGRFVAHHWFKPNAETARIVASMTLRDACNIHPRRHNRTATSHRTTQRLVGRRRQ